MCRSLRLGASVLMRKLARGFCFVQITNARRFHRAESNVVELYKLSCCVPSETKNDPV